MVELRRRAPEKMLQLAAAAGGLQVVMKVVAHPADCAMLVIVYTRAANGRSCSTVTGPAARRWCPAGPR